MATSLSVLLDGVQVGARLTGALKVDAAAGKARLASLSYLPAVAPARRALLGRTLTIDLGGVRVFTGRVDAAPRERLTGLISIRATDRLQEHAQRLTEAAILTAIPGGHYPRPADGTRQSGWEQLQAVVSTAPGDYDLAADGTTGRWHAWGLAGTPDHTYAAYIEGTLEEAEPDGSALVNRVDLEVQYRYARLRHREINVGWAWPTDFCGWHADPYYLPTVSEIEGAAKAGPWTVQGGVATAGLPETPDSGTLVCNGVTFGYRLEEAIERGAEAVTSATWTVAARAAQWVTETYRVRIEAPLSQALYGLVTAEMRHTYSVDYDTTSWDNGSAAAPPEGGTLDALGDYVIEAGDPSGWADLMVALIGRARRMILDPHRQWELTFQVPLDLARDLGQTIELDCADVHVIGQVAQVVHSIDTTGTGGERTTLTLALRQSDPAQSQTDTPVSAPARLVTAPTHGPVVHTITLPTHLGGRSSAADQDASAVGWSGNYQVRDALPEGSPKLYQQRFDVVYPAIEAAVRDALEVAGTAFDSTDPPPLTYLVAIPHDLLEDA